MSNVCITMKKQDTACPRASDADAAERDLRKAVAQLYLVFCHYGRPSFYLNACTGCCMDPAFEQQMRAVPLGELCETHFYQYNNAAKTWPQPAGEIKYFLPRMLDLLAGGKEIHHSQELCLERLGCCEGGYTTEEQQAVDAWALAYFRRVLTRHQWQCRKGGGDDDAFVALLMFEIGGIKLQPLLDHWRADSSTAATLHYVSSYYDDYCQGRRLDQFFADDRPVYRQVMRDWLDDHDNKLAFAERLLRLEPESLVRANHFDKTTRPLPRDLVEAVLQSIIS